jgi:hypothetical protein
MAICTPEVITPTKYPATDLGPKNPPSNKGVKITIIPGITISLREAFVAIWMH